MHLISHVVEGWIDLLRVLFFSFSVSFSNEKHR